MSSFEVYLDHERHLVIVTAFGEIVQSDGEKIIKTAREKAAEHNYDIFYDMRETTTIVAFASWYMLPRNLEVFKLPSASKAKAAVLISKTDKALDGYKFYEIVTENLGLRLRVFFEKDKAFEWLAEETSSEN